MNSIKNKIIPILVKGGVRGGLILVMFLFLFQSKIKDSFAQGTPWTKGVCVVDVTTNGVWNQTITNWHNVVTTNDVPTIQGFECLFANILKIIVTVAGLAFLIMFIVGGFQYMQSSNDPKAVAAASSTLTYAIIGLVGVIVSWLILLFIEQFTGINITQFSIPK